MPRTKKGTLPAYPTKPHNGQARLTVLLTNNKRICIYLGPFASPESRQEYLRVLALLNANDGKFPVRDDGSPSTWLTLDQMAQRFWRHAETHYRLADGQPSREQDHFRSAMKPLLALFGKTFGHEFGPLAFKAVRQQIIDAKQILVQRTTSPETSACWLSEDCVCYEKQMAQWQGEWHAVEILKSKPVLSRKVINQRMDHIKRFFAWCVSEELIPPSVHEALLRVAGLRRGHQGTREMPRVKPVSDEHIAATIPFLVPQLAAMIQLQPLIGARPTEVCLMRGRNIMDRDKPVWKYVIDPNEVVSLDEPKGKLANLHKCAHLDSADGHAKIKILPLGPRAQAILKAWLRENPDEFLFQPCEARAAQYAERRNRRKTPLYKSHLRHQARKRKAKPKRVPRDHYDRHSYAQAITRAARKAGVPHWHPHQLKHVCGTKVREEHGAEAAQGYMGHEKLSTAELYAEKNWKLIEKIAIEMG